MQGKIGSHGFIDLFFFPGLVAACPYPPGSTLRIATAVLLTSDLAPLRAPMR
jgi:hypothetical protein